MNQLMECHKRFECCSLGIQGIVWNKLQYSLANGELHNYRFLLSLHHKHFEGVPGLHPIEGLVSGFHTEIDPADDPGKAHDVWGGCFVLSFSCGKQTCCFAK